VNTKDGMEELKHVNMKKIGFVSAKYTFVSAGSHGKRKYTFFDAANSGECRSL